MLESKSEDAEYFRKVDIGRASTLESLRFALDYRDVHRISLLHLLLVLASASKVNRVGVGFTVQWTALQLASYDVQVDSMVRLSTARKAWYIL